MITNYIRTTTNPSTVGMVATVFSKPHNKGDKVSKMIDEYRSKLINKYQFYE